jgi:hypothetical protein
LDRLLVKNDQNKEGCSSDEKDIQTLRDLVNKALGTPCRQWTIIPEGHVAPSTVATEGHRLQAVKGQCLSEMRFTNEDFDKAFAEADPSLRAEMLVGYAVAREIRVIADEVLTQAIGQVKGKNNLDDKAKARLEGFLVAARKKVRGHERSQSNPKLSFERTALSFEAAHPLPKHPTAKDFHAKRDAALTFVQSKQKTSPNDMVGWTPWTKTLKPEYDAAQKQWAKDAAAFTPERSNWEDAREALGIGHKAIDPLFYFKHVLREIAQGKTVDEAVRHPLSSLIFKVPSREGREECLQAREECLQAMVTRLTAVAKSAQKYVKYVNNPTMTATKFLRSVDRDLAPKVKVTPPMASVATGAMGGSATKSRRRPRA